MAKDTKYISSGGLAFTEHKDMKKLSRWAAKGWHLESFALFGYRLRKGEPKQAAYCVDYNHVKADDMEEYEELFEAGGWTRVCSSGNIHVFTAPEGKKPIYTDKETNYEKYRINAKTIAPLLVVPLITILLFILVAADQIGITGAAEKALRVAGLVGFILSVPILMTFTSSAIRLLKAKK